MRDALNWIALMSPLEASCQVYFSRTSTVLVLSLLK